MYETSLLWTVLDLVLGSCNEDCKVKALDKPSPKSLKFERVHRASNGTQPRSSCRVHTSLAQLSLGFSPLHIRCVLYQFSFVQPDLSAASRVAPRDLVICRDPLHPTSQLPNTVACDAGVQPAAFRLFKATITWSGRQQQ